MPETSWLFDTVSLSNFLLSGAAYIIEQRYGSRGLVTWEVYDELSAGFAELPELKYVDHMIDNQTLTLVPLSKSARQKYSELIRTLGKGEASCIAAARVKSAIVVTDDRAARKMCRQMAIPVTGTVGILKASVLQGLIRSSTADEHLERMIKAGFYSPVSKISEIV